MTRILTSFQSSAVTLTAATPTPLGTARPARLRVDVTNTSGAVLYLGGPGVTAGNGYPLANNATYSADCAGGLFALSVAGGTVGILEGF